MQPKLPGSFPLDQLSAHLRDLPEVLGNAPNATQVLCEACPFFPLLSRWPWLPAKEVENPSPRCCCCLHLSKSTLPLVGADEVLSVLGQGGPRSFVQTLGDLQNSAEASLLWSPPFSPGPTLWNVLPDSPLPWALSFPTTNCTGSRNQNIFVHWLPPSRVQP